MNPVQTTNGVIVSHQGTSPGPASGITYTVRVNMPEGPVEMSNVRPHGNRYPDELKITAATPGSVITVHSVGSFDGRGPELQFVGFDELPHFKACDP